jgi:hypothetical protein
VRVSPIRTTRATAIDADHAVLVVYVDGEALLIDDMRAAVVPAESVTTRTATLTAQR